MAGKTRFHALLETRILEEVEREKNTLADGGCTDHHQYKLIVGRITGLMDALKLCDQIEEEFE